MKDLQQLLRLYLVGKLTFDAFRASFLETFLTSRNDDGTEGAINIIESACDDFSEKRINEAAFRSKLVRFLPLPSGQSVVEVTISQKTTTSEEQNTGGTWNIAPFVETIEAQLVEASA